MAKNVDGSRLGELSTGFFLCAVLPLLLLGVLACEDLVYTPPSAQAVVETTTTTVTPATGTGLPTDGTLVATTSLSTTPTTAAAAAAEAPTEESTAPPTEVTLAVLAVPFVPEIEPTYWEWNVADMSSEAKPVPVGDHIRIRLDQHGVALVTEVVWRPGSGNTVLLNQGMAITRWGIYVHEVSKDFEVIGPGVTAIIAWGLTEDGPGRVQLYGQAVSATE